MLFYILYSVTRHSYFFQLSYRSYWFQTIMETILNIVREQGDPIPSQGENGEEEEVSYSL